MFPRAGTAATLGRTDASSELGWWWKGRGSDMMPSLLHWKVSWVDVGSNISTHATPRFFLSRKEAFASAGWCS